MKYKGLIVALGLGAVVVAIGIFSGNGDTEKLIRAYTERDSAKRVARRWHEYANRLRYDSAVLYRNYWQSFQVVAAQVQKITQLEAREKSYKILLHKRVEVYTPSQLDSVWRELFPRPDSVYFAGPAPGPGGR